MRVTVFPLNYPNPDCLPTAERGRCRLLSLEGPTGALDAVLSPICSISSTTGDLLVNDHPRDPGAALWP